MRYLTLELCKRHLYVEYSEDDSYIEQCAESAEDAVEAHLQAPLETYEDAEGKLPAAIIRGMLLLVGSYYANREGYTSYDAKVHASLEALLNRFVDYGYTSRQS